MAVMPIPLHLPPEGDSCKDPIVDLAIATKALDTGKFSAIHSAPRRGRDPISTQTNLSNILASSRRLLVGERESVRQLTGLAFQRLAAGVGLQRLIDI